MRPGRISQGQWLVPAPDPEPLSPRVGLARQEGRSGSAGGGARASKPAHCERIGRALVRFRTIKRFLPQSLMAGLLIMPGVNGQHSRCTWAMAEWRSIITLSRTRFVQRDRQENCSL